MSAKRVRESSTYLKVTGSLQHHYPLLSFILSWTPHIAALLKGWTITPLVDYHGGGAAAAFEPLSQHTKAYEFMLAQFLGAGVGSCYR